VNAFGVSSIASSKICWILLRKNVNKFARKVEEICLWCFAAPARTLDYRVDKVIFLTILKCQHFANLQLEPRVNALRGDYKKYF